MTVIRAASIGLGWWGGVLASRATSSGEVEIASCFARTPETREAFAAEHGCTAAGSLEEILDDPSIDALLVATPHSHHRELIETAAARGKHLFVEKPLTLTVDDGRACVAAAEEAGVVLQVGHHRRRSAANRRLRGLVDEGSLGLVHHLEATIHVARYQDPLTNWRADPAESPAGALTALGVHMIDTMQYLAGPIVRISAYSKRILGRWQLDDATVAIMEFASGPVGVLSMSLVMPNRCDVSISGTDLAAWSEEDGSRLFLQPVSATSRHEEPIEPIDEVEDELAEFARCVRSGAAPETGGPEALQVVAVQQALIEAVRTGESVEVPTVGQA